MVFADHWKHFALSSNDSSLTGASGSHSNVNNCNEKIKAGLYSKNWDIGASGAHKGSMNAVYINGAASATKSYWAHSQCLCNDVWNYTVPSGIKLKEVSL